MISSYIYAKSLPIFHYVTYGYLVTKISYMIS